MHAYFSPGHSAATEATAAHTPARAPSWAASLAFALALALAGCSGASDGQPPPSPSPMDVGSPRLPLSEWLQISAWPASEGAWKTVYSCNLLNVDKLVEASTSRRHSVCAYQLSQRLCTSDWEGADAIWTRCCAGEDGTAAFCRAASEQIPFMGDIVELYQLYRDNPNAIADHYYYHGTTRSIDADELPEQLQPRVQELHRKFATLEMDLMLSKHATLDANVPVCLSQGNNWAFYCFKRARVKGGSLMHYDTHADFAYRRDGYPHLLHPEPHPDDAYWVRETEVHIDIDEYIQPALLDGTLYPRTTWVTPKWTREYYPEDFYHINLHQANTGEIISFSPDMAYDGITYGDGDEDDFIAACIEKDCSDAVTVGISMVENARQAPPAEAPIFLNVDLDYFGSTNPSPEAGKLPTHCPDPAERQRIFDSFAADIGIMDRPAVIPVCLSPDFSCDLWDSQLLGHVLAMMEKRWGPMGTNR